MKKRLFFIAFLIFTTTIYSQNKKGKPFFTGVFNVGLGFNENWTVWDTEDDQSFLEPVSIMARVGFGYQFNSRWAISAHAGLDDHYKFNITAIPTYGSLRYNITESDDGGEGDTFFIETSYGKMWRPTTKFEDGKYFSIGLGTQIAGFGRWNTIIRLDFHRKSILNFENSGHLDSISLGIGFSFF